MAGIRFKIRTILASISDDFNRADGALTGMTTTVGAKVWAKLGVATTVAAVSANRVRATSGTGNSVQVVDTGSTNFTALFKVAAVNTPTAIPSFVFRVQDESNHWMLQLRFDGTTPGYSIARRVGGSANVPILNTGVAPVAGDVVRLEVTGTTATLFVNNVQRGAATTVADFSTRTKLGFSLNGSDLVTSFDDLIVYNR